MVKRSLKGKSRTEPGEPQYRGAVIASAILQAHVSRACSVINVSVDGGFTRASIKSVKSVTCMRTGASKSRRRVY